MVEPVEGVQVIIDEDDDSVRVDPVSGTVETDQPDGGVVVQLDAHRPKKDGEVEDFYRNLVDDIDETTLQRIAGELHDAVSADDRSRGNWLAIAARGLDFLGLEIKEPRANAADSSAAVEGLSTVTNPMLLDACLRGWANAQAELLPSEGPVKVSDESSEPAEAENELADALERDMNHYLTVTAPEYYADTSHMLLWGVYFKGSGFKKIYRCPLRRRPVSDQVAADDLIVSNTMKDLRSCARITHQIEMRPSVLRRMEFIGAYRKSPMTQAPNLQPNEVQSKIASIQGTQPVQQRPEDQPYTIWETQCELDLDQFAPTLFKGEGITLPYLVTMDKESREIKAIRRDWKEDDENAERKRMYVRYPYVPGPGFYGTGMLNILGNASQAMTAAWRLALDNSMFANFPGGVIDKSAARQNTADFRMSPGTFEPLELGGRDIRQVIMASPYRDTQAGLLALMDKVTQQCKSLGGAADIPAAEGIANVPVGTMLAQIEQATKVMAAAHKGMHQAQSEEIELLVDLFRATPEDFYRANKICPKNYWNEQRLLQALDDCTLVPRSDPNTPSHIHRVAKALALSQLFSIPAFAQVLSPIEALTRIFRVIREDPTGLIMPPPVAPAAPDPNAIAAAAKLQQAQTAQVRAATEAQSAQADAQIKTAQLGVEQNIATVDLAKEMVIHGSDASQANKQHGLNVQQAVHDQGMDLAQHALNVHQALTPPAPADSGGGNGS